MNTILQSCDQLSADLVNHVLAGKLPETVTDVTVKPLGEGVGLMSSIARANLTFESGSWASIIVKCAAQTDNKAFSKQLNFYFNEINFYRHLAHKTPLPSPKCLFADIDPETQDFLLILEDLGDAEAGDQLQGCTAEEMLLAFELAARMHALYWDKTDEISWLNYQNVESMTLFRRDAIFRPGVEPTIAAFPELFVDDLVDVVRKIGEQYADLFNQAMSGPSTLIHGDYRIDNMFLMRKSGELEIIAVDWQNTTGGNGLMDTAYFSAQSCGTEHRGDTELKALRHYHDVLTDNGVKNYSFDQCVEHYRLNLLITMITPIAVCGTLDAGNERGDELGRRMLERSLAALTSMECNQLLAR